MIKENNFYLNRTPRLIEWESSQSPRFKEYRRKWRINPEHHAEGHFPLHLDIEATSHCNIDCVMCPRTTLIREGQFWEVAHFPMDLYKQIVDEGARNNLYSIKFNYMGEPLMNPHLPEMITYAKDAGILDTMLNTNATLLTTETAHKLIESGLDQLFFSIDSPIKEKYEKIRIGADFDKVLANIRNFSRIRDEMGSKRPFTRVSMVTMKGSEDDHGYFEELFTPIVDTVGFGHYVKHNIQEDNEDLSPEGGVVNEEPFSCPQLFQRLFIAVDGTVTVCCADTSRTWVVGDASTTPIKDIWLGDKCREIRHLHSSGNFRKVPMCSRCTLALLHYR